MTDKRKEALEELMPCPFCGNDGKDSDIANALQVSHSEAHSFEGLFCAENWTVQCDKCTATMGFMEDESEAITAWNTRALSPDTVHIPRDVLEGMRQDENASLGSSRARNVGHNALLDRLLKGEF